MELRLGGPTGSEVASKSCEGAPNLSEGAPNASEGASKSREGAPNVSEGAFRPTVVTSSPSEITSKSSENARIESGIFAKVSVVAELLPVIAGMVSVGPIIHQ
jgi:hypothetical protein